LLRQGFGNNPSHINPWLPSLIFPYVQLILSN